MTLRPLSRLVVLVGAVLALHGEALRPRAATSLLAPDVGTTSAVARTLGASPAEADDVARVYGGRGGTWVWTTALGTPAPAAAVMRLRFGAAAAHGLDPAAYDLPELRAGGVLDGERLARRDVAMTLAALRYMRHLHLGRVDPRRLGLRLQTWDEPHDFARMLSEALAAQRVGPVVDGLAPPFAVYRALVAALARYRALAGEPLPALPPLARSVRPGDTWARLPAMTRRLVVLGDLEAAAAPSADPTVYGEPVVTAVRRFQARHGLTADGTFGARTRAALAVSPAARADQIALALERLRWLPDLGARRVVAVNIPMFRLWAWEPGPLDQPPVHSMEVIVGRALRSETPVFVETMDHVIFRPYWNVPPSIVRDEVLPAIARNPRYLAAQQMEIVRGPGDDAVAVPATAGALAALADGTLRLRQRPGPHNALGLVKFVFPNRESVYMHGTPRPALFARDRRDFSHGCIRVADPPALAAWALAGRADWSPARIAQAMQGAAPERVALAAPIDVVLFYMTASVGPDDDALHFADDIYGHDAALARALATRR